MAALDDAEILLVHVIVIIEQHIDTPNIKLRNGRTERQLRMIPRLCGKEAGIEFLKRSLGLSTDAPREEVGNV